MHNSIWNNLLQMPHFPRLDQNLRTDVLVIGGGMAGVLCAHRLSQSGVDYVLIEADRICHGVTRNTTAKITPQHGLLYGKLIREYQGFAKTVDCDFEPKDKYIYAVGSTKELDEEMSALEQLGIPAQFVQKLPLPLNTAGAIRFRDQAQFNPLKLVSEIANGLNIYEKTAAKAFKGDTVLTDRGKITASKIIVATGFNKWGMTTSMVASMILSDLVHGRENLDAEVFSPSRTICRPQLFINGFEAAVNLVMPTKPRCPYMGCALKWNPQEHSWDCPCHGSRFAKMGACWTILQPGT